MAKNVRKKVKEKVKKLEKEVKAAKNKNNATYRQKCEELSVAHSALKMTKSFRRLKLQLEKDQIALKAIDEEIKKSRCDLDVLYTQYSDLLGHAAHIIRNTVEAELMIAKACAAVDEYIHNSDLKKDSRKFLVNIEDMFEEELKGN